MKPIRIFISSVQREFAAERAALRDSLRGNEVAHRDYTSNGSVQVMLFADRLEVWNPGRLPSSLTLPGLRKPHASVPHNPVLPESLYLAEYIERMGTGNGDMIRRCREAGLREPEFTARDGFVVTFWRPSSRPESFYPGASMSRIVSGKPLAKVSGKISCLPRKQIAHP